MPTLGYEMPYNAAQIVVIYNPALVPTVPTTMLELVAWIIANPGKFAWPAPTEANDFTAAALMRMMFGAYCPYDTYAVAPDLAAPLLAAPDYQTCTGAMWAAFARLSVKLYGYSPTQGRVYPPKDMAEVDNLFAAGTVAFTWSYDSMHAATKVAEGDWTAANVRSTLLDGTVGNYNFVAVPRNAPNLAGAMVVANELASPAQVYARAKPEGWGTTPAVELSKLPLGWQDLVNDLSSIKSALTPTLAQLAAAAMAELPVNVQQKLEHDWVVNVAQYGQSTLWNGTYPV